MTHKQETFSQLMESFSYRYDLRTVFDDFLTMSICAVSQNPVSQKSHDEELYMETIARYAKDEVRFQFPKLFARLVIEMEDRVNDSQGNDVLGEYYELQFCSKRSGQFFTPPHVCDLMAKTVCGDVKDDDRPMRILDPTCGSGRMLLSASKVIGKQHEFYGIDIDQACVKMTALNCFLNGMFHSEILCADALQPDDFRISYIISLLPFGIFRIREKEHSKLWHLHRNSFNKRQAGQSIPSMANDVNREDGSQLKLF